MYITLLYLNMSSSTNENERWRLIDHYLSLAQTLNTQSQQMHVAQNEVYSKLCELISDVRISNVPHIWNHVRPNSGNRVPSLFNTRMNVTAPRRSYNTSGSGLEERTSGEPRRRQSRNVRSRLRTDQPSTSSSQSTAQPTAQPITQPITQPPSQSTNEEGGGNLNEETSPSTEPQVGSSPQEERPPAFPRLEIPTLERRQTINAFGPSISANTLFGATIGSMNPSATSVDTNNTFPNFIQEFNWTTPQESMRPFNFFSNVPVFPTPDEIVRATRIIPFGVVDNPINTQCPITLAPFNNTDNVMQILHCGHIFDIVHLNGWFRNNVRCPVCRYDIRETEPGNDEPSSLAPDDFIENDNETDPEMPPLVPLNETSVSTEAVSDSPPEEARPPLNILPASEETVDGFSGPINITPIWSYNNSLHSNSSENGDAMSQILPGLQNAITTQGLTMLSTAINQSIRESFPSPPPNTSQPSPNVNNNNNNNEHPGSS